MRRQPKYAIPWLAATVVVAATVGLGGCQKTREAFGLEKSAPDEFAVVTRAPLTMPPDYGLRPPSPGAPRPQEREVKEEARRLLVQSGRAADDGSAAGSPGQTALLGRAGAANVDPGIRQTVSRESQALAEGDKGLVDRLMFWRPEEAKGAAVDPTLEAKRLRENSALGDAATKGPTPVIQRKKRGLLEGLF